MNPKMKNLTIKPYILNGIKQQGDFGDLFQQLYTDANSGSDRLGENYSPGRLHLNKMYNFNFVMNNNDPVLVSGSQICSQNVVRVFSRYYVFRNYRTQDINTLNKTDNFLELKYTLNNLENFKLIIWSRDKGPRFFNRIKKDRTDLFRDWYVHPKKIELMYKNNWQSIFYKGNISYLHEVFYDNN